MSAYKPAINEEESKRIEELMKELEKVHRKEKQLATELRRLIYKADKR